MKAISRILLCALLVVLDSQNPAQSAQEIWTFATPEPVLASPTIAPDGTVYLASYDRNVYALTPRGTVKWMTNMPPPIYIYFGIYTAVYGTPAIGADGTVYVPSENGKLLALNPTNGAVKWEYATLLREGLYSSPALGADGTIYFGSYDGSLYAINPNGTRKWASHFDSTIFASPAVGQDGTIYCGCDDGRLYALNPTNGSRKWTFNSGPFTITASPAIGTNGTLYVGVGSINNPTFYSISTNGTTNWMFTTGSRVRSSAALGPDGTIYFGCDDGKLYALNEDGSLKWVYPAGGAIGSSPAVASDGTIYFGCDDGKLYAVDAAGNYQWSLQTSNYVYASPAIGPDGAIYFASADGSLHVIRGCRPPIVSAWPMFRNNVDRTGHLPIAMTNHSPVLVSIADEIIVGGSTLIISNAAFDPDLPGQHVGYSLGLGAPAGATIDPISGVFQWTPTAADASDTNSISVVVADDGTPRLTDTQCFRVIVLARTSPRLESIEIADSIVTLRWQALAGRTYRVEYKTNLDEANWVALPGDVTATADTATKSDPLTAGSLRRFYRVELLP